MVSGYAACIDCGKPIDPQRDYRRVTGWERQRVGGGLHSLKGRQETGEWLHKDCYDLRLLRGQGSMF